MTCSKLILVALAAAALPPSVAANAAEVPADTASFTPTFAIAATYGGSWRNGAIYQGPGVSLEAGGPDFGLDPDLWLDARYILPHDYQSPGLTLQTITLRAGGSIAWSLVRVGLGFGFDRDELTSSAIRVNADIPSSSNRTTDWQPAARIFARLTSPQWNGFSASVTGFLDVVHSPDPVNAFRAGLSFEVWWRS